MFNSTGNDAWSDLPRRKSFVPLIDRLLAHLSGDSLRRNFQVGDTVALPLPARANAGLPAVRPSPVWKKRHRAGTMSGQAATLR